MVRTRGILARAIEALADGVAFGPNEGEDGTFLCHSFCEIGATPLPEELGRIRQWLEDNPREVLILIVQDYVSVEDFGEAMEDAGLRDQAWEHDPESALPTLGDMIDDERRVFIMGENNGEPGVTWYSPAYEGLVQETPHDSPTQEAALGQQACAPLRGGTDGAMLLINHWVAVWPPLVTDARVVNQTDAVRRLVEQCVDSRGRTPNLISVNFGETDGAVVVANELNGIEQD